MSYIRMNGTLFNAEDVIGVYTTKIDNKIRINANLSNGATFCIGTYPPDAAVDGILSTIQQNLDKDADIRENKRIGMEIEAHYNLARKEAEIARREELANATMKDAKDYEEVLRFQEEKLEIQKAILEKDKQTFEQRVKDGAGMSPYELVLNHPNFNEEVNARTDSRRAWAFNYLTVGSALATYCASKKFKDMRKRAIRATRGAKGKKKLIIEPLNLAIKALGKQIAAPTKQLWDEDLLMWRNSCPCCGEGIAYDWLYCPYCGQRLRKEKK